MIDESIVKWLQPKQHFTTGHRITLQEMLIGLMWKDIEAKISSRMNPVSNKWGSDYRVEI
jgi:hypothetical protein